MLYAARVESGVKQRRPTELHCACVGGVSDVDTCAQSATAGRNCGAAATAAVVLLAAFTESAASASAARPIPARPSRDPSIRTSMGGRDGNRPDTGCGSGLGGRYPRQPDRNCAEPAHLAVPGRGQTRPMARTTYYTAMTLDGFLADEHDSLDWLFVQDQDEKGPLNYDEFIKDIGALVMGATTYEWILANSIDKGESWVYDMPAWVMTHREHRTLEGADIRFVQGDVAPIHDAMVEAAAGKNVWMVGGGDLAAQFAEAGRLDEV